MSDTAHDTIKGLMKETLTPHLKNLGFEKYIFSWHRFDEDTIKVIDVQLFKHNTSEYASFTLNLGIYHDKIHEFTDSIPFLGVIKHYDCDVQIRVGKLFGLDDYWWKVFLNKDNQSVNKHFTDTLDKYVYPWIDEKWDLYRMFDYFVSHEQHFLAAAAAYLLHQEEIFIEQIKCLIDNCQKEGDTRRKREVEKWLIGHKLTI
jgi:hypothetical protein